MTDKKKQNLSKQVLKHVIFRHLRMKQTIQQLNVDEFIRKQR